MSVPERERKAVVHRATQALWAQVRYFDPNNVDIPADTLAAAARYLYTDVLLSEGGVSLETFEWFLNLQHEQAA